MLVVGQYPQHHIRFWPLVLQKYGLTVLWLQREFGQQGDRKPDMQFEIKGALLV